MARLRRTVGLSWLLLFLAGGSAAAFDLVSMNPHYGRFEVFPDEPLKLVFTVSMDPDTVTADAVAVYNFAREEHVTGGVALETTALPDDTLAFYPDAGRFPWAERLQVLLDDALRDVNGDPFVGALPVLGVFVANVPRDLERPAVPPGPGFPVELFVNSNVLLGFNPLDPESTDPEQINYIPGMSLTEAWKLDTGDPGVLIAIVDDGVGSLHDLELAERYFLNQGELPQPERDGLPCDDWDCNGDGRFSAGDYADDPRAADVNGNGRLDPDDLLAVFADLSDGDDNGLVDDICGWDFFRDVKTPYGVPQFPEGDHGEDRARDAAGMADNGHGSKPGTCPDCSILPIRVGEAIMTEFNLLAEGVAYALAMGADVIVVANGVMDYAEGAEQIIVDAYDAGVLVVAAAGDELGFHHIFPAAGEDAYNVKAVMPLPPVELFGPINLSILAFTESYCTNHGAHTDASGVTGACSSEATSNVGGIAGLLKSYGRHRGYELSPGEMRQLMNMTADDIRHSCFAFNLQGCRPGWEQNFGYGRINALRALQALGDPLFGLPERIPPDVRLIAPRWWTTLDPRQTPSFDIEGTIDARGRPYEYSVELGLGVEPRDNAFVVVQTGRGTAPTRGTLATVDIMDFVDDEWLRRRPEDANDFTVTLRVRAWWTPEGEAPVEGQARKAIAWHLDDEPETGLLPGFPQRIGASGVSSPVIYDLDGDPDGREEIVFATALPSIEAYKYDAVAGEYEPAPGFPVALPAAKIYPDSVIASAAVGPLFGDGVPYIVVATTHGLVYAVHPDGDLHAGGPFVEGFPVSTLPPDNSSPLAYGHGNAFVASPALADLDGDGMLEIIAASYDQHLYAWRPVDEDHNGVADTPPGWPVPLFSDAAHNLVPPERICQPTGPAQVLGSPAVGILDPDHADPDISRHPAIIVSTTETCVEGETPTGRLYAVYWDGLANQSGPFLPGWPAVVLAPSGDSMPIPPLTIGLTASPAAVRHEGELVVSTGSFFWFPQLVYWDGAETRVRNIFGSRINLGVSGNGTFGRFTDDGRLWYFYPTAGFAQFADGKVYLVGFSVVGWPLDNLSHAQFIKKLDDINFFINPVLADLSGDGRQEMIAGSGGYIVHAVDVDGAQPDGWPKFTQNWQTGSVAVGDADGDRRLEVFAATQEGNFFAWQTRAPSCAGDRSASEWSKFHHDPYNTAFYDADAFPPRLVRDLTARTTANPAVVELRFTAPGDDGDCGTPAAYDIRYTADAQADLRDADTWTSAPTVPAPQPVVGGTAMTVTVQAPDAAAFALRAYDDEGLASPISNQAPVEPFADDDDDDDNDDDDSGDDDDDESPDFFDDDDATPDAPADDESSDESCGCN